jgi:hypothetical protein
MPVVFVPNPFGVAEISRTQDMSRAMTEVATAVEAVAKVIAPILTGAYVESIHVEQTTEDGKAAANVVADVPYAVFVEFGTGDTPAFAPLRRASESVGVLNG